MKRKLLIPFITILLFSYNMNISGKAAVGTKDKSPIVTLSPSNYAKETAKGFVIVDFWAAWCGPCRRLAPILEEIAKEYKDQIKIGKVNVDNYKKFSIDMGVEALPTLIVYKDGKEVTRIRGLASKADLVKLIEQYSPKKKTN